MADVEQQQQQQPALSPPTPAAEAPAEDVLSAQDAPASVPEASEDRASETGALDASSTVPTEAESTIKADVAPEEPAAAAAEPATTKEGKAASSPDPPAAAIKAPGTAAKSNGTKPGQFLSLLPFGALGAVRSRDAGTLRFWRSALLFRASLLYANLTLLCCYGCSCYEESAAWRTLVARQEADDDCFRASIGNWHSSEVVFVVVYDYSSTAFCRCVGHDPCCSDYYVQACCVFNNRDGQANPLSYAVVCF
jgi:hypothetical protein